MTSNPPHHRFYPLSLIAFLAFGSMGGCPPGFKTEIVGLAANPNPARAGSPVSVSFTLVSWMDDKATWTAELSENPFAGGTLPTSGGVPPGERSPFTVTIAYITRSPTNATIKVTSAGASQSITVQVQ